MRFALAVAAFCVLMMPADLSANGAHLEPTGFSRLPGWSETDHAKAYRSFVLSCREILETGKAFRRKPEFGGRKSDWTTTCKAARTDPNLSGTAARTFFENQFRAYHVTPSTGAGLFTGYYAPEFAGSKTRSSAYMVPVYAKPADLVAFNAAEQAKTGVAYGRRVAGKPKPYFTREQIETGALAHKGLELVWLKSWADAFFLQVQGSGRVRFEDGSIMHLGYAAKTGLPYTAIGAVLIEWGEVAREDMSMQAIRAWMDANPKRARALMWHNKSFVFFKRAGLRDPKLGPVGAQGVQLQPGYSLAVDRTIWAYGTPMFIETVLPGSNGQAAKSFNRLMIAQDTGTAIRGHVRGDIFVGAGADAADLAGRLQSPGKMFVLLPRPVARRLGLSKQD